MMVMTTEQRSIFYFHMQSPFPFRRKKCLFGTLVVTSTAETEITALMKLTLHSSIC